MVDCLSNGFFNVVYLAATGGLMSIFPAERKAARLISGNGELGEMNRPANGETVAGGVPTSSSTGAGNPRLASGAVTSTSQERLAERYKQLARSLKCQGQTAEAKAAWEHALELLSDLSSAHPNVPEYQSLRWNCANDLAWFLLNERDLGVDDLQEALHLAREATEAEPLCAAFWNTQGVAYYRTDDPERAIKALERSISLNSGGTAFDFVFLALSHIDLGQLDEARSWGDQAERWINEHGVSDPVLSRLHEQVKLRFSHGQARA
jgi:tetratricopeptide (TPR) repeat protein